MGCSATAHSRQLIVYNRTNLPYLLWLLRNRPSDKAKERFFNHSFVIHFLIYFITLRVSAFAPINRL